MASGASSSRTDDDDNNKSLKQPVALFTEDKEIAALLLPSLYRLTEGLPRKELKMMVSEAMICEEALENEIKQLHASLQSPADSEAAKKVQYMLDSEITPPDRFFTVSALLGRLRDDLATPLPPNSILPEIRAQSGFFPPPPKKKKKESNVQDVTADSSAGTTTAAAAAATTTTEAVAASSTTLEKHKKVLSLYQNPEYTKEHAQPTALMTLWKKISTHRSSLVFRRPVNPKEAPGYTDRIAFPMDLSLIRKMIVARQIKSFSDLHQRLGLICHNCVKYNGRESDYGVVTRDFESTVDEMVVAAVLAATEETRSPAAPQPTPPQPKQILSSGTDPVSQTGTTMTQQDDPAATVSTVDPNGTGASKKADNETPPECLEDATIPVTTTKLPDGSAEKQEGDGM